MSTDSGFKLDLFALIQLGPDNRVDAVCAERHANRPGACFFEGVLGDEAGERSSGVADNQRLDDLGRYRS